MSSQHKDEMIRWGVLGLAQRGAMALMLLCFSGILALLLRATLGPIDERRGASLAVEWTPLPPVPTLNVVQAPDNPTPTPPVPTTTPVPSPTPTTPPPIHVGVVAGHWQYDPGAVCADGLREVDVTVPIAQRVVALLEWRGYEVDMLSEYDDALIGYQADALISIHADSCSVPGLSGFKVARVEYSSVPEEEDQLVDCLWSTYAAATGLSPHWDTITLNMRNYHAFRTISPSTPGAIIETGFMLEDRWLLENRQYEVALGIANGVVCFLEGE